MFQLIYDDYILLMFFLYVRFLMIIICKKIRHTPNKGFMFYQKLQYDVWKISNLCYTSCVRSTHMHLLSVLLPKNSLFANFQPTSIYPEFLSSKHIKIHLSWNSLSFTRPYFVLSMRLHLYTGMFRNSSAAVSSRVFWEFTDTLFAIKSGFY